MATINATVVEARVITHPTTGAKTISMLIEGPMGVNAVTTSGGHQDHSQAPAAAVVGATVVVTITAGAIAGIAYTA